MKNYALTFVLAVLVVFAALSLKQKLTGTSAQRMQTLAIGSYPPPVPTAAGIGSYPPPVPAGAGIGSYPPPTATTR